MEEEYYEEPKTSGLAITSLVLGILSCLGLFLLLGIPPILGVVFGIISLGKIKKSDGLIQGKGLAIAGIITSCMSFFMVAVFGILAAMLMPALAKSRAKAMQVQSKNNLKQIGINIHFNLTDQLDKDVATLPPLHLALDGISSTDRFFNKEYQYSGEIVDGVKVEAGAPYTQAMQSEDVKIITIKDAENSGIQYAPIEVYSLRGNWTVQ